MLLTKFFPCLHKKIKPLCHYISCLGVEGEVRQGLCSLAVLKLTLSTRLA